ncbi:MAG: hypothetical protein NC207_05225 [Bacteroides sp.]|nr:hypothetical protein [Bacteroides sp.]
MKPAKVISLIYLGLYLLWLPLIYYLSWAELHTNIDRPQSEEHIGVWGYFAYGSIGALLVIILLWSLTIGAYYILYVFFQSRKPTS